MRIDDFCCLGRTVPEDSKKYGKRVCMAGYSEELRELLRIYPLPIKNPLKQRSLSRLEVQRPREDSRRESWRIIREMENCGVEAVIGEKSSDEVRKWLSQRVVPSIHGLNGERTSLGVIKPANIQPFFRNRDQAIDPSQKLLFGSVAEVFGEETAKFTPYIRFNDERGGHALQLREWGCYEWLRKQPDKASQLWDNLRLGMSDHDYLFVVGNMCNHRNVWLVINIFPVLRERTLFDSIHDPKEETERLLT